MYKNVYNTFIYAAHNLEKMAHNNFDRAPLAHNPEIPKPRIIPALKAGTISYYRRAPHELFPKKGVPHQIPAGLEIFRNSVLAWRF